MTPKIIVSDKAPAPVGPYSQAIEFDNTLYCSGQIPLDQSTGEILRGDIQAQTKLVMENVGHVLREAGLEFKNIIKTTIFIKDMDDFAKINEVYAGYFPENPPARSCVEVARLPKDVEVEVEVLAKRF